MIKPRHPSQNPYWHEYHKPHVVDPEEIKSLCLQCLHIVLSSNAISMLWVDDDDDPAWEYPNLAGLHHKSAEALLSNALIKLAVLIRVFDDQLSYIGEDQGYTSYKKSIDSEQGPFGTFYEGSGLLGIRESCNKIIHAEDFRPVYDNDSSPRDEGCWAMNGIVEMTGYNRDKKWMIGLNLFAFLEAVIDLTSFGQ